MPAPAHLNRRVAPESLSWGATFEKVCAVEIAALTTFLAPFLPHLLAAGENIVQGAAKQLSGEAWEHAKRLWGKLRGKVDERESAREAAEEVAKAPEDPRAVGALELQLEKLLAADPALLAEVTRLWEDAQRAGVVAATGDRSIAIGGDASSSVFITGDQNTVSE